VGWRLDSVAEAPFDLGHMACDAVLLHRVVTLGPADYEALIVLLVGVAPHAGLAVFVDGIGVDDLVVLAAHFWVARTVVDPLFGQDDIAISFGVLFDRFDSMAVCTRYRLMITELFGIHMGYFFIFERGRVALGALVLLGAVRFCMKLEDSFMDWISVDRGVEVGRSFILLVDTQMAADTLMGFGIIAFDVHRVLRSAASKDIGISDDG